MTATRDKGSRQPLPASPECPGASTPDLDIEGPTHGSIHYGGNVIVGPAGVVAGGIHARTIVVAGEVRGNLHAEVAVRLVAGGRVTGDIHAPRVAIDGGATLVGRLAMRRRPETPAVIDGAAVEAVLTGRSAG